MSTSPMYPKVQTWILIDVVCLPSGRLLLNGTLVYSPTLFLLLSLYVWYTCTPDTVSTGCTGHGQWPMTGEQTKHTRLMAYYCTWLHIHFHSIALEWSEGKNHLTHDPISHGTRYPVEHGRPTGDERSKSCSAEMKYTDAGRGGCAESLPKFIESSPSLSRVLRYLHRQHQCGIGKMMMILLILSSYEGESLWVRTRSNCGSIGGNHRQYHWKSFGPWTAGAAG